MPPRAREFASRARPRGVAEPARPPSRLFKSSAGRGLPDAGRPDVPRAGVVAADAALGGVEEVQLVPLRRRLRPVVPVGGLAVGALGDDRRRGPCGEVFARGHLYTLAAVALVGGP